MTLRDIPVIWSVAGTDSGGGAGLAADQRAADALGVHCCTVVAGITAQSTTEVTHIEATPPAVLQAQLETLAADMPPRVIKTGLLGSADNVRVLAHFVDQLRQQRPLALVVDPVLRASTGAALADAELRAAYRDLLLPRATVITPNQGEAVALLGDDALHDIPAQARALRARGCEAVVITGGDAAAISRHASLSLDWLDSPQAQGWLSLPREATPHNHGTGCTFAGALAAALARIGDGPDASPEPVQRPRPRSVGGLPGTLAPWLPMGLDGVSWRALVPGIRHFRFSGVDSGGGTVRLLAIAPGTALPHHGHGGTELTLVLSGSFADEIGRFQAGDLADLDPSAKHQPVADTDRPCMCLIATDARLRFSGVLRRLFQPLVGI